MTKYNMGYRKILYHIGVSSFKFVKSFLPVSKSLKYGGKTIKNDKIEKSGDYLEKIISILSIIGTIVWSINKFTKK